jgi:hypothetical protein
MPTGIVKKPFESATAFFKESVFNAAMTALPVWLEAAKSPQEYSACEA